MITDMWLRIRQSGFQAYRATGRSLSLTRGGAVCFAITLSLLLHLLYLYENDWGAGLVSAYLQSDAYYYFHKAWFSAFISDGGGMLSAVIPFSPYISLVTTGFKLFGAHLWVPFAVSAICVSLSSGVMVLLAHRLFTLKVGFLAGILTALCGVFIFYSGLTVKSGFVLLGTCLIMYLSVIAIQEKSYSALVAAICAITITSYDRDNLIIVILPLIVFFIRSVSNEGRLRLHLGYTFLWLFFVWLGIRFIVDFFWTFDGVSNWVGVNFYVGNAPGATGGYTSIHGFSDSIVGLRLEVYRHLLDKYGEEPDFWQRHSFMLSESFNYYLSRPFDYVLLKSKQFLLLLSQYSYGHPEQYAFWRFEYYSTTMAFIDWRWIVASCCFFFYQTDKTVFKDNAHLFMLASGAFYAITIWAFLVTERYRLPLYLIFMPYSAWALHAMMINTSFRRLNSLRLANVNVKPIVLFFSVFVISSFLNSIMVEGVGWSTDRQSARNIEISRKYMSEPLYEVMKKIANKNDHSSMIKFAEIMIRQKNCEDATGVLRKAMALENSKHIQRLMSLCKTKLN